ncbi:Hypothetical protein HVR_LOCUS1065 [uncultured virus]|nr:Hypothetical protein HVR_LOCUS1065 [uncultured virus]
MTSAQNNSFFSIREAVQSLHNKMDHLQIFGYEYNGFRYVCRGNNGINYIDTGSEIFNLGINIDSLERSALISLLTNIRKISSIDHQLHNEIDENIAAPYLHERSIETLWKVLKMSNYILSLPEFSAQRSHRGRGRKPRPDTPEEQIQREERYLKQQELRTISEQCQDYLQSGEWCGYELNGVRRLLQKQSPEFYDARLIQRGRIATTMKRHDLQTIVKWAQERCPTDHSIQQEIKDFDFNNSTRDQLVDLVWKTLDIASFILKI